MQCVLKDKVRSKAQPNQSRPYHSHNDIELGYQSQIIYFIRVMEEHIFNDRSRLQFCELVSADTLRQHLVRIGQAVALDSRCLALPRIRPVVIGCWLGNTFQATSVRPLEIVQRRECMLSGLNLLDHSILLVGESSNICLTTAR